jgi:hypothetical protein
MPAALTEQLIEIARAAEAAGHGAKTKVYAEAAKRLGMSVPTLLKHLKSVAPAKARKRRSDAGNHALSRDEALLIAATVEETRRLTGTGEIRLEDCIAVLRENHKIRAAHVDTVNGEEVPLSLSAIRRALQHYGLHPDQLAQPSASTRMQSEHPNHVWQLDASISRQYYLADSGTELMDASVYYRGKPDNFLRINDRRIVRYAITDHCSGHVLLFYVLRAESALNVVSALIYAMTARDGIAMHGIPRVLYVDKGTYSATLQAFCDALGIELIAHAAGNARATGQVECSHNLIETTFEAPLKLRRPVMSIDEINALVVAWCAHFNATRLHSRTRATRRDGWLRITREQLRIAPRVEVLRLLATTTPKTCTVRDLRIKFRGAVWDVSALPGVLNGAKLQVALNPFDDAGTVRILVTGEDGRAAHYLAPRIQLNEWGFEAHAPVIGKDFGAMPETPADAARKEIERLAMQAQTDAEAAANRKAKRLPFGGDIDPTKHWREVAITPHLPRAGTPSEITAPAVIAPRPDVPAERPVYEAPQLDHTAMAVALKRRVEQRGAEWTALLYQQMATRWPNGVTEEQLDDCAVQLLRGGLRIAGGAA